MTQMLALVELLAFVWCCLSLSAQPFEPLRSCMTVHLRWSQLPVNNQTHIAIYQRIEQSLFWCESMQLWMQGSLVEQLRMFACGLVGVEEGQEA